MMQEASPGWNSRSQLLDKVLGTNAQIADIKSMFVVDKEYNIDNCSRSERKRDSKAKEKGIFSQARSEPDINESSYFDMMACPIDISKYERKKLASLNYLQPTASATRDPECMVKYSKMLEEIASHYIQELPSSKSALLINSSGRLATTWLK